MSRQAINDLIFGEPKGSSVFTYTTKGGKEFQVKMYHPSVKDKGWLLAVDKFKDRPEELFVEVLMRADIRDIESNERLFDATMKDSVSNSDQDLLIKMAGDWLGILNQVKQDDAVKN